MNGLLPKAMQRNTKNEKKILLTIDDGFKSFYEEAWPYLKENEIPFILFVSTEPIGKRGYMTWEQIKEIEKEKFAYIGNHSHTHEYLIDVSNKDFILDIETANKIFLKELGYVPSLFSYPFGEYSLFIKSYNNSWKLCKFYSFWGSSQNSAKLFDKF